jgi:hypothetical protein
MSNMTIKDIPSPTQRRAAARVTVQTNTIVRNVSSVRAAISGPADAFNAPGWTLTLERDQIAEVWDEEVVWRPSTFTTSQAEAAVAIVERRRQLDDPPLPLQ